MIRYLDTSAALKLVIEEPESVQLATHLDNVDGADELVSSMLLFTGNRHCAAARRPGFSTDGSPPSSMRSRWLMSPAQTFCGLRHPHGTSGSRMRFTWQPRCDWTAAPW